MSIDLTVDPEEERKAIARITERFPPGPSYEEALNKSFGILQTVPTTVNNNTWEGVPCSKR